MMTCCIVVSSCNPNPKTETHEPPIATSSLWIVAPTGTLTPTLTLTPSPTLTATISPSPLPTLLPNDAKNLIISLLKPSNDCSLPCWWNVVPGFTKWSEAERFLSTFSTKITKYVSSADPDEIYYSAYFKVSTSIEKHGSLIHTFKVKNNNVYSITADTGDNNSAYSLRNMLTNFGFPQEIYLRTFSDKREDLPFYMILFYPAQGFSVLYFDDADIVKEDIRGCFSRNLSNASLWLQAPDMGVPFSKFIENGDIFPPEELVYYQPLSEVSDVTVESFLSSIKSRSESCITTSRNLWPSP